VRVKSKLKRIIKEETMEKIAVHVPNEHLSRAVQEHLFNTGKKWGGFGGSTGKEYDDRPNKEYGDKAAICLYYKNIVFTNIQQKSLDTEIISVDEYFKRYDKPIKIGEHEVKNFTDKGFEVGCQKVSWAEYDEIGKRRPE
jgi:hypothetical protein